MSWGEFIATAGLFGAYVKKMKEDDLIKKACIGWLRVQFEEIAKLHEPQIEQEI